MIKRRIIVGVIVGVLLAIGAIIGIPRFQDYQLVKSEKKSSVNSFTAPGGIHTIQFITKGRDLSSVVPNVYFVIEWRDVQGKILGSQNLVSDSRGIATAVLPDAVIIVLWSGASGDYLPVGLCDTPQGICDTRVTSEVEVSDSAGIIGG